MESGFNSSNGMDNLGAFRAQFESLLSGSTDREKADFLRELHIRGETGEEITTLAQILREHAGLAKVSGVTDIVGTGGDGKNTINVSTAASLLVSSMGIKVAKHGNFGATSNKGSADFLKFIGYDFNMDQEELERRLKDVSFAFLLAPMHNSNFAKFAAPRKMLTFKTVFNYLGPLTNPADPDTMVLGVSDPAVGELYSDFLALNSKKGYVVHSLDGMDELSPYTLSTLTRIAGKTAEQEEFDPISLLGEKIPLERISAINPEDSFRLTVAGLSGKDEGASKFIALNAALSLVVNGKSETIDEAYHEALGVLKTGYAMEHVGRIMEDTR